jgi:outer membrane protein OmpU
MKKSLLATTALAALGVATVAAPASAEGFELKVGGFMEQWFGYTDTSNSVDDAADAIAEHSDVEIHIKGSNTLDNGLTFGFLVEMEGESTSTENADEQYMTVEGSFGKIIMGSENTAPYLMHYTSKTNGVGVEEGDGNSVWAFGGSGTLSSTMVHGAIHNDDNQISFISPRMNGVQVGVSFVPEQDNNDDNVPVTNARQENGKRDNGFGVAANYETAISDMSIKLALGYTDAGSDDTTTGDDTALSTAIQLGFGGFTYSLAYGERKTATTLNTNIMTTSVAYSAGPMGVSLLYANGENTVSNEKQDFFEFGANYAIGAGVTAKGSIYAWNKKTDNVAVGKGQAVVGGIALSF